MVSLRHKEGKINMRREFTFIPLQMNNLTTILHNIEIPNKLFNSAVSNGLNANNSTNQKLNIKAREE
jgi:hypothetical protein